MTRERAISSAAIVAQAARAALGSILLVVWFGAAAHAQSRPSSVPNIVRPEPGLTIPRIVGNEPSVVWESSPDPGPPRKAAPMSTDEARSIALAHDAAHNCEITARMLRESAWVFAGQIGAAVALLIGGRILTEIVTPADFGLANLIGMSGSSSSR